MIGEHPWKHMDIAARCAAAAERLNMHGMNGRLIDAQVLLGELEKVGLSVYSPPPLRSEPTELVGWPAISPETALALTDLRMMIFQMLDQRTPRAGWGDGLDSMLESARRIERYIVDG